MNGVPMEEKYLSPEDFEEQLLTLIMKETQVGGWLIDCALSGIWFFSNLLIATDEFKKQWSNKQTL